MMTAPSKNHESQILTIAIVRLSWNTFTKAKTQTPILPSNLHYKQNVDSIKPKTQATH